MSTLLLNLSTHLGFFPVSTYMPDCLNSDLYQYLQVCCIRRRVKWGLGLLKCRSSPGLPDGTCIRIPKITNMVFLGGLVMKRFGIL
jgi:hypothetical protein